MQLHAVNFDVNGVDGGKHGGGSVVVFAMSVLRAAERREWERVEG